ncbi:MAG: aminotransferase class V-fold PLP-dependent enzyme [Alphaproteobacteria bacterium]|nr:aminotransferase class V-fold PLP-dependent enzyme [Alphaproteobacteria bacterium]
MASFKSHFAQSIGRPGAPLHFAAHSHHPWPDITFAAQQQYWQDASQLLDRKWGKVFGEVIPRAQAHVARHLNLSDPRTVVFAPNTHSLLVRLLSATHGLPKHNVLSTDGEFHSFTRQMNRLAEDELVNIVRVAVEPLATFKDRFIAELKQRDDWDMVWFSHVFFNSGLVLSLDDVKEILAAIEWRGTFAVIDGYHAFMARPTDLSAIASRVFYIAGGYKYAMAGEGACFMHCPPGYGERPRDTGWYAEFGALEQTRGDTVAYGTDASRFSGATFDPSGLYRFNAVMDWLQTLNLDVAAMDDICTGLQHTFIKKLDGARTKLGADQLVVKDPVQCGRFLTFETKDAAQIDEALAARNVLVDHRGDRLRIGFGIYQDEGDVDRLLDALKTVS